MGAPPPNPLGNKNKGFKPSLLSAFREQQGGKNGGYSGRSPHSRNCVPVSLDQLKEFVHQIQLECRFTPQLPEIANPGQLRQNILTPHGLPRSVNNRDGKEKGSYEGFAPKPAGK